jgi:ribosomal protein S18 acetylase RimI-like enzyme
MSQQAISFRPITEDDMEFLYRVYASTREAEMALLAWSDQEKEEFLRFQFNAQHTYYQQHFVRTRFDLILLDGQPIGRLYLDRRDDEVRIVDIALLPQYRGRGIGGQIMGDILQEAGWAGLPVRIHVEQNNPALRLYHRLGFKEIGDEGVYYLMEWQPPRSARSTGFG